MHARIGDDSGRGVQRHRDDRQTAPDAGGENANAAAECPDGNDSEVGILTRRATACCARGSGLARRQIRLTATLTTALVTAIELRPCAAARGPGRPPDGCQHPATPIHTRE